MGKNSIIIYDNDLKMTEKLPVKLKGEIFRAIIDYRLEGKEPDFKGNILLEIIFSQFKTHLDLCEEKYKKICERNKKVAQNRWAKEKGETFLPEGDISADVFE